ncbi:MAG: hypothetical protein IAG10_21060 [Planctomycetaceae bacterium]|nr:hypothetical protein [Planctomycetaceae bacterium]
MKRTLVAMLVVGGLLFAFLTTRLRSQQQMLAWQEARAAADGVAELPPEPDMSGTQPAVKNESVASPVNLDERTIRRGDSVVEMEFMFFGDKARRAVSGLVVFSTAEWSLIAVESSAGRVPADLPPAIDHIWINDRSGRRLDARYVDSEMASRATYYRVEVPLRVAELSDSTSNLAKGVSLTAIEPRLQQSRQTVQVQDVHVLGVLSELETSDWRLQKGRGAFKERVPELIEFTSAKPLRPGTPLFRDDECVGLVLDTAELKGPEQHRAFAIRTAPIKRNLPVFREQASQFKPIPSPVVDEFTAQAAPTIDAVVGGAAELKVFRLQKADASDAFRVIQPLLPRQAKVSVDQRTNSLILSADAESLAVIEALLRTLDEGDSTLKRNAADFGIAPTLGLRSANSTALPRDDQDSLREREAKQLAARVRAAKEPEKSKFRAELEVLTEKHFELRQQRRKQEIDELSDRVDKLRVAHHRRQENKADILKRRVADLLDADQDLQWDDAKSGDGSQKPGPSEASQSGEATNNKTKYRVMSPEESEIQQRTTELRNMALDLIVNERTLGKDHPKIQALKDLIGSRQLELDRLKVPQPVTTPLHPQPIDGDVDRLKTELKELTAELATKAQTLGMDHPECQALAARVFKLEITTLETELKRVKERAGLSVPADPDAVNDALWSWLGFKLAKLEAGEKLPAVVSSRYRGGMRVTEVRAKSSASANAIRQGDILVGLHNFETVSFENVKYVLEHSEVRAATSVKFYVVRGSETLYGFLRWRSEESEVDETPADRNRSEAAAQAKAALIRVAEARRKGIEQELLVSEEANKKVPGSVPILEIARMTTALEIAKAELDAAKAGVDISRTDKPKPANNDEPTYNDVTLSEWLQRLENERNREKLAEAVLAMSYLGSECEPQKLVRATIQMTRTHVMGQRDITDFKIEFGTLSLLCNSKSEIVVDRLVDEIKKGETGNLSAYFRFILARLFHELARQEHGLLWPVNYRIPTVSNDAAKSLRLELRKFARPLITSIVETARRDEQLGDWALECASHLLKISDQPLTTYPDLTPFVERLFGDEKSAQQSTAALLLAESRLRMPEVIALAEKLLAAQESRQNTHDLSIKILSTAAPQSPQAVAVLVATLRKDMESAPKPFDPSKHLLLSRVLRVIAALEQLGPFARDALPLLRELQESPIAGATRFFSDFGGKQVFAGPPLPEKTAAAIQAIEEGRQKPKLEQPAASTPEPRR